MSTPDKKIKSKPNTVQIWLTEHERELIEAEAKKQNRSISNFAKAVLLNNLPVNAL